MAMKVKWFGEEVEKKIRGDVERKVKLAALHVEGEVKRSFGPHHPAGTSSPQAPLQTPGVTSGELRNSITHEVERRGDTITGRVGTNLKYARMQEVGGVIRPVRARALMFTIDGQFVMTQEVHIPARPYLRPGLDKSEHAIERIFGT